MGSLQSAAVTAVMSVSHCQPPMTALLAAVCVAHLAFMLLTVVALPNYGFMLVMGIVAAMQLCVRSLRQQLPPPTPHSCVPTPVFLERHVLAHATLASLAQ